MLAIKPAKQSSRSTAHLLPCRIHYDGKVSVNNQIWNPERVADSSSTDSESQGQETTVAHFRGRKLLGRVINVPDGYHGAALSITETSLGNTTQQGGEVVDESSTRIAEQVADFDKFVIWRHESLPEATEDAYVKGIDEWMNLAELIHAP